MLLPRTMLLTMVAFGACLTAAAAEQTADRRVDDLRGWSSLTLGADKAMVVTATSTLGVARGIHPGTGRPAIVLKTRSVASLLGARGFEEETISYIDPHSHHPLEFVQIRPGDSARRFRFNGDIVSQSNWVPPNDSPEEPLESWSRTETSERKLVFANGEPMASGEWPTDFYSLIYLLGDLDLETEDPLSKEFTAMYRRHLVRVRVTTGDRRTNERKAINEATGRSETLRLSERSVTVQPIGEGADSFRGFLGMEGETRIWLDEKSGAIVEIDGRAPTLGPTQVMLKSFRR